MIFVLNINHTQNSINTFLCWALNFQGACKVRHELTEASWRSIHRRCYFSHGELDVLQVLVNSVRCVPLLLLCLSFGRKMGAGHAHSLSLSLLQVRVRVGQSLGLQGTPRMAFRPAIRSRSPCLRSRYIRRHLRHHSTQQGRDPHRVRLHHHRHTHHRVRVACRPAGKMSPMTATPHASS